MVGEIIEYLNKTDRPLVIIDEADKLKDPVLNLFKTFHNKTNAGFLLAGAPFFEKRIRRGVRLQKQAYEEIYSRIGGEFIHLRGINNTDIRLVCHNNGVMEEENITMVVNFSGGDLRRVKAKIDELSLQRKLNLQ